MARLTDPERLAKYQAASRDWQCSGVIGFSDRADEWMRVNLPKCTWVTLFKLMRDYVFKQNGEIDEVKEERHPWKDLHDFHHDLRPEFRGKTLYFETRLCYNPFDARDDSTIFVANLKWA